MGLVAAVLMSRMRRPDDVANAAVFLASDDSSYVTAIELFIDGGMAQIEATRAAPRVEVRDQGVLQWSSGIHEHGPRIPRRAAGPANLRRRSRCQRPDSSGRCR